MKKCILIFFLSFSFFLFMGEGNAETFHQEEVSNGIVLLSISTDQGYLETLDTTISVEGNVSIQSFSWDSSLDGLASKEYQISSDGKTIRFLLASKAENILKESKTILLGKVTAASSSSTTYQYKLQKFSFSNLDQEHVESNSLVNKDASFSYQAPSSSTPSPPIDNEEKPDTPSEDEKPGDVSPPSSDTPSSEGSNQNSSGSSSGSSSSNSSSSSGTTNSSSGGNTSSSENSSGSDTQDSSIENGVDSEDTNQEEQNEEKNEEQKPTESHSNAASSDSKNEEKKENSNILIYTSIIFVIIFIVGAILFLVLKKRA